MCPLADCKNGHTFKTGLRIPSKNTQVRTSVENDFQAILLRNVYFVNVELLKKGNLCFSFLQMQWNNVKLKVNYIFFNKKVVGKKKKIRFKLFQLYYDL